ncbi:MAG TPA: glucose 1-dehydrogenase [Candidatus Brocadiia bacterium]|nr:glucose 1-dehydrogenase [Candidatus Brocadiia bacterium]
MISISLERKVAIVTGSASGIGKGIAFGLARAGAHLVIADINLDAARGVAAEIAQEKLPKALALAVDVTNKASVEAMVDAALKEFGRLDILVNNAGIAPSAPLTDFSEQDWDRCVTINLKGYFLCGQAVARVLIRQGQGGSIINISSKSGVRGSANNSAYNATKFGVIGLAQGWAQELAQHKIRVNSVLPGNVLRGSGIWNDEYIRSRAAKAGIPPTREAVEAYYNAKVPLNRQCYPEDVANMVVFLCSDMSSYVTGCSHLVDGGQEMR